MPDSTLSVDFTDFKENLFTCLTSACPYGTILVPLLPLDSSEMEQPNISLFHTVIANEKKRKPNTLGVLSGVYYVY